MPRRGRRASEWRASRRMSCSPFTNNFYVFCTPMSWNPAFKGLLKSFNDERVRYLLVGGYAVILHGHPRSTIDLDLWIEPSEANAASIIAACETVGLVVPPVPAHHLSQPNQVIRMGVEPQRIDLITTLPGLEFSPCWERRRLMRAGGLEVPVIDLASLRITKLASGRFQDLADLENLPEA